MLNNHTVIFIPEHGIDAGQGAVAYAPWQPELCCVTVFGLCGAGQPHLSVLFIRTGAYPSDVN
ncbi:hypothetical protein D3C79_194390 [compost metagenome]